jgi:hypothetical protein
MRYADGGGLTMEGRSRREQVRLRAAEMFAHDADARQIARELRGQHQVGLPVAAGMAGRRRGGSRVEGCWR